MRTPSHPVLKVAINSSSQATLTSEVESIELSSAISSARSSSIVSESRSSRPTSSTPCTPVVVVQASNGNAETPSAYPTVQANKYDVGDGGISSFAPSPPVGSICRYQLLWLWPLLFALGGILVGIYFIEGREPFLGTMVLVGGSYLLSLVYIFIWAVLADRSLLINIAGDMECLLGSSLEDARALLSSDLRVKYVQQLILHCRESISTLLPSDPLYFLVSEMGAWERSQEGFIAINPVGIILYCNEALAKHLQYGKDELLGENISILMPTPYDMLHSGLMRKYDRNNNLKKVVNCPRHMPIVTKLGNNRIVEMFVEEHIDPKDASNSVFTAQMQFPRGTGVCEELQQQVNKGTNIVAACRNLHNRKENFLVINTNGTIVFTSNGMSTLLGWKPEEMEGKDVGILMNAAVASSHHEYLTKYVERMTTCGRGVRPSSVVVGQGRDMTTRCQGGGYIRIWLTVDCIDIPGKGPEDCYFVGAMVYMQGTDAVVKRRQASIISELSSGPLSSRSSRSSASSHSSFGNVPLLHRGSGRHSATSRDRSSLFSGLNRGPVTTLGPKLLRITNLAHRRCTVMLFDIHGLLGTAEDNLGHEYQALLNILTSTCNRFGAHLHDPIGDRILVTLNLTASGTSQRSIAGNVMHHVMHNFYSTKAHGVIHLYAAACTTESHVGTFGKQAILVGEGVDLCACMLQIAAETRARRGLIDPSLHGELQFTYECRMINIITVHPRQKRCRTIPIYEMFAPKELSEDEWLYQVDGRQRDNPLAAWTECWRHLQAAASSRVPGQVPENDATSLRYTAALGCLFRHLKEYEGDQVGLWLVRALHQGDGPPSTLDIAGKIQYYAHFTTA